MYRGYPSVNKCDCLSAVPHLVHSTDSAALESNSAPYVYYAIDYILISRIAVRNAHDGNPSNKASPKCWICLACSPTEDGLGEL